MWITPHEVARVLRVHINTVYNWIRQGRFRKVVHIGREYRIDSHEIETTTDELEKLKPEDLDGKH